MIHTVQGKVISNIESCDSSFTQYLKQNVELIYPDTERWLYRTLSGNIDLVQFDGI